MNPLGSEDIQQLHESRVDQLESQVQSVLQGQDRLILQAHEARRELREIKEQLRSCSWIICDTITELSLQVKDKEKLRAVALRLENLAK